MTRYFTPVALLSLLFVLYGCGETAPSIPVVKVGLQPGAEMLTITNWRISGPFRLPEKHQVYTEAGFPEAFGRDYLTEIEGREVPLMLPPPTTNRPVDFEHDPNDYPELGPAEVQFMDQVQQFPTPSVNTQVLFWRAGEFFKITYAAVVLESETDAEAALLVSGNSPVKVWLNDKELLQSPASKVGHDPDVLHVLTAPLKRGRNTLLLKLFCFPKRNEFVVRFGTRERALAFVRDHGGLRDVVEQVVIPPGQPLQLSDNLSFFSAGRPGGRVRIDDAGGRGVFDEQVDFGARPRIETGGFQPGLYTITASVDGWEFSERFYLGVRETIASQYKERCAAARTEPRRSLDPCASLEILEEIATHLRSAFRLDWQKRALFHIEQIEQDLAPTPDAARRGVRVFAYRSPIDGQTQYYFLRLPRNYDGRSVPLVVVNPHNTVQKPLLSGPVSTNPDWLHKLSAYADEYGYACLWTHGRGRNNNVHLAMADTLEALDDVQKRFAIDADRVYLSGDCGGARNALLFAQRFPDRIAAVSVLNSATSSGLTANSLWREGNSPRAAAENLLNIPLQLIHGDHFPHSPTQQSIELREASRRVGIEPELILLPGDSRWSERDPFRISFAFFQGKARQTPRTVSLATGQLKYGSAYWLRVTELARPPAPGRVNARFEGPGRLTVKASDVSALELLPGRFPADVPRSGVLEVSVNGQPQSLVLRGDGPVRLRVLPADAEGSSAAKTPAVEGPVSHAFASPFVLVPATDGGEQDRAISQKLADQIEKTWRDSYYVSCPRKTAAELTPADIAASNLVITGGPNVGQTIKRLVGSLPLELDARHVSVGDKKIESGRALLSAVYPHPLNPSRYVVVIASNSPDAAELPASELARSGSYDVAVWQFDGGAGPRLFGEWYWDKSWSHLVSAGAVGKDADAVEGE